MPLDVYSACPGGTGKKIKFCCTDLLGDLQKIERMLEGEQFQACLSHIERLETKHPGRACLMGIKCLLLRGSNRLADAETTAAEFLRLHPNNPIALAETAILTAAKEGGQAAVPWIQKAMAACTQEIPERVGDMLGAVGQILLMEGHVLSARVVLQWAATLNREDPMPMEMLGRINASQEFPVWLKDERRLLDCPADAPWRAEFDAAVALARRGQWSAGEEKIVALAATAGDQPAIWRSVAVMRGWQANSAGCAEALRKFAAMDVPLEDAVEAEAIALFLSEDPLGDQVDVLSLTYAVSDPERFQAAAASANRMQPVRVDLASLAAEGEPAPLAAYFLHDRPVPAADANLTLETLPRLLCQAFYFGRQTDREARLELHPVAARDLQTVQTVLTETAGDSLGSLVKQEVTEQISRTQELLARNWPLSQGTPPEQINALTQQHYEDVLLQRWPALPLAILDGKSPQKAAAEPRLRVRLLAAILLLEFWMGQSGYRFDFNRLRSQLGLPALEPIDPEQVDVTALPATRLARVPVEKLSKEALMTCLQRSIGFNILAGIRKFGRAFIERPDAGKPEERLRIYSLLARVEEDSTQALFYADEGRKAAEGAGQSSAAWDLLELSIRFARRDEANIQRLWRHISTDHIREPGVASALHQWLVQIGAVRPDGTPAMPAAEPQPSEPGLVVPSQGGAESGKLWTPGGEQTAGEKPKLWTPGMS